MSRRIITATKSHPTTDAKPIVLASTAIGVSSSTITVPIGTVCDATWMVMTHRGSTNDINAVKSSTTRFMAWNDSFANSRR